MTVPATASLYSEYVADGAATPRSIGFSLRRTADLVVEADGVVQVEGQHYSVTGTSPSQSIVPLSPYWADGMVISYYRYTERKQEYDIVAGVDLRAESLEDELDRGQQQQQEQDEEIARALKVTRGEVTPTLGSLANKPAGSVYVYDGAGNFVPQSKPEFAADTIAEVNAYADAAFAEVFAILGSTEVTSFAAGVAATAVGGSFHIYDRASGQVRRYVNGTSANELDFVFAYQGVVPGSLISSLQPGASWSGAAGTGFAITPSDPTRTTAKPVCRLLDVPRQTITGEKVIGVLAMANDGGSLFSNLGLSHVNFYFEGNTVQVVAPTFRTFTRYDGSTYSLLGWWVSLGRTSVTVEGVANLYVEAVPTDATMQSRVIGPHPFLLYDDEFDFDVTVAAGGGGDYTNMSDAFNFLRTNSAQRPRITVIEAGTYDFGAATGTAFGDGYCTIEASAAVTFAQSPPVLTFDFTRASTRYDRLHYKGSNITLDFVETLQFDQDGTDRYHWLDGVRIRQSRGREDLWRGRPRNIIPSLFENGAFFTDCKIEDVNDWGDKAPLARGNITASTWADALQDTLCAVGNIFEDHSSEFYYTNVDALSLQYAGAAATATISLSGGNMANGRVLTLKEDGVTLATFTIDSSEQGYRDDTNYTIQNVVDWINSQVDWSATLIDNSRFAAALTFPASTSGAGFTDLDAKSALLTLPTHFDIHSDIYQLPNLGAPRENVVFAFNRGWGIDAQVFFITGNDEAHDFAFVGNAIYNNLGTADEGLKSQLQQIQSHVIIAHNSVPTQKLTVRPDISYDGDAYCLVANNVFRSIDNQGGGALDADITVANNHVTDGSHATGSTGGTSGGDASTLFEGAITGNFTPAGALLTELATPALRYGLGGIAFATPGIKGALAA